MNCHKLNTNYRKVNTMYYITDPTPAPPLQGRGVGFQVSSFRFQVRPKGRFQVLSVGCCLRESATLRDVERQVLSVASLIAQRLPAPVGEGQGWGQ